MQARDHGAFAPSFLPSPLNVTVTTSLFYSVLIAKTMLVVATVHLCKLTFSLLQDHERIYF